MRTCTGCAACPHARILERTSQSYDHAVMLLTDLRDASALVGMDADFQKLLRDSLKRHTRKSTLIRRIERAGFQ